MYLYKKTSAYRSLKSNSNNDYAEVAADAVAVEPVSTAKFPANREKNREFFKIAASGAAKTANNAVVTGLSVPIPYPDEQGIILAEQGILPQEQGNSPSDKVFGTHRGQDT
jgi:hypothetical protein